MANHCTAAGTAARWQVAAGAVALTAASLAQAAPWVDFAQFDASSSSSTLVLVRALGTSGADAPAPLLSATATRWADGQAAGVGAL